MTPDELTGRSRTHLVEVPGERCHVHAHVVTPFRQLRRAAAKAGFDLAAASAFRDFERQLAIWNAKFDAPSAGDTSTPAERISAILRWSALPGASRHHWGTDLDLIDRAALTPGYRVRLVPEEYSSGGPFAAAASWLDANASRFGFFRPYRGERSGVQPEAWHFSFAPVAEPARRQLNAALLRAVLADVALGGRETVMLWLEEILSRYVHSIDLP